MIDEKILIARYVNQMDELFNYLANKTGMIYHKETNALYPSVTYKYYKVDSCYCYEFGIYYDGIFFKTYDNGYKVIEESYPVDNKTIEEVICILLEGIKEIKLESIKIRKNNINVDFLTDR